MAAAVLVTILSASCGGGTSWGARFPATTVQKAPPADAAVEFRRMAQNTLASLQSAIEDAAPGSPAAAYFTHRWLSDRAYASVGGSGRPLRLVPVVGGVGTCTESQGQSVCWEFQRPRYSADGRLSSFDVNQVDVGLLVRGDGSPDAPQGRVLLASGASVRIVSLLRDPEESLSVVLGVDNPSNAALALPDTTHIRYQTDTGSGYLRPVSWAYPANVPAHSALVMSLRFAPANFEGTLQITMAEQEHDLRIAGPAVALRNTAVSRA